MELLPIFLNIRDRKCVVVGGGEIARRKANLLVQAGASLQLVAKSLSKELQELAADCSASVLLQAFTDDCLSDATLVIAATDDRAVNRAVSDAAKRRGIPVNVVDQPELCTFIMPSIVDRSPVVIAISSSGNSPVLARKLKELIEVMVPGRINKLAELLGSYRSRVKSKIPESAIA